MFRFTIRDVLLLMAIVGLALGWGLDHWRLAAANSRLEKVAFHLFTTYVGKGSVDVGDGIIYPYYPSP